MPVSFLPNEQRENYGRYTVALSQQDLARYFHLDDADYALITKKRGDYNRLGFAVQLCTARYLGTFLDHPFSVPASVIHTLSNQLCLEVVAVEGMRSYSIGEQRWQHAAEIRTHYGYVEITERQKSASVSPAGCIRCVGRVLTGQVCCSSVRLPGLVTHKVLLPGYIALSNATSPVYAVEWRSDYGDLFVVASIVNSKQSLKSC
jgi:hypothetical protein